MTEAQLVKVRELSLAYLEKKRDIQGRAVYASDWGNVTTHSDPSDTSRETAYGSVGGILAMMRSQPPITPLTYGEAKVRINSRRAEALQNGDEVAAAVYQEALTALEKIEAEGDPSTFD